MFGIWHCYKHAIELMFRRFRPFLVALGYDGFVESPLDAKVFYYPKLIKKERGLVLLYHAGRRLKSRVDSAVRDWGRLFQAGVRTQAMQQTYRGLTALKGLVQTFVPAMIALGKMVRSCAWDYQTPKTGHRAKTVVQHLFILHLTLRDASHDPYITSMCLALMLWTPFHDRLPAAAFVEERCEAMFSRLCSQTATSKTSVTHGDWALAFKALNTSPHPDETPVGVPASGPGLVAARIGKLLTAIDKNKVPSFCQVVGQSSGPGTWVWPGAFAFPKELTPVLKVRLSQVFLTSCHTLFYHSSRKATREQLVELTAGLVATIDPLLAAPDTTQFYTNFNAAYHRLSLDRCRAADSGGPGEGGVEVEVGVLEFHQGGVHL